MTSFAGRQKPDCTTNEMIRYFTSLFTSCESRIKALEPCKLLGTLTKCDRVGNCQVSINTRLSHCTLPFGWRFASPLEQPLQRKPEFVPPRGTCERKSTCLNCFRTVYAVSLDQYLRRCPDASVSFQQKHRQEACFQFNSEDLCTMFAASLRSSTVSKPPMREDVLSTPAYFKLPSSASRN